MQTNIKDHITAVLRLHRINNPILAKKLESDFRLKPNEVREIIRDLRRERLPIVEIGQGYFWAVTAEEFLQGWNHFRSRWRDMAETDKEMEQTYQQFLKSENKVQGGLFN